MNKKKIFARVFVFLVFFLIISIFFGQSVKNYNNKIEKNIFDKLSFFIASVPDNFIKIIKLLKNPGNDLLALKKNKQFEDIFALKKNQYYEILLYSRYDGENKKSIIDIIDLSNFKKLHTFNFDFSQVIDMVNQNSQEFKNLPIQNSKNRVRFFHPLVDQDSNILFHSDSPLIKSNLCGEIIWINNEDNYHHSINVDEKGNYWVPSRIYPYQVKEEVGEKFNDFYDDGISYISKKGELIKRKSVTNILIENGYKSLVFGNQQYLNDPIHLNDIEPVLEDGEYWKKGDVFLSPKHLSVIIHYRPSTNKIINLIRGPFYHQHDIDIINNKQISIFNNNNIALPIKKFNRTIDILIYDFEKKTFSKIYEENIKDKRITTKTEGLSDFLHDGSIFIEEQNYGKIHIINKKKKFILSLTNDDNNDNPYILNWSRIINNKAVINNLKNKLKKLKCKK